MRASTCTSMFSRRPPIHTFYSRRMYAKSSLCFCHCTQRALGVLSTSWNKKCGFCDSPVFFSCLSAYKHYSFLSIFLGVVGSNFLSTWVKFFGACGGLKNSNSNIQSLLRAPTAPLVAGKASESGNTSMEKAHAMPRKLGTDSSK